MTTHQKPQPHPGILALSPYIGGEGRLAAGGPPPVRMASNENPYGCSPAARAAYISAADELYRYPDGTASALRTAIAQRYKLPVDGIVCGAGSEELIFMIARAYAGPGDEVIHTRHGFLMYAVAARAAGATPVAVDERALMADVAAIVAAITPRTKIIMLANPNNPTGTLLPREDIARLVASVPSHIVIVLDAAYAEYVEDEAYQDGAALVAAHENVVMLRTFSKAYGLAALRVGWGYFPPEMADAINRLREPFNVSAPAQAAAIAALADDQFLQDCRTRNKNARTQLAEGLTRLGLAVVPSAGNFLLVDCGEGAEALRLALKERGVFVRQMGAYHLPRHLRITVGRDEDNARLLTTLREILSP